MRMTAEKYATLYGLKYDGRKRIETKMLYVFTDLITDNTIRVGSLNFLAQAVQTCRGPAFGKMAGIAARARALELSEKFYGFAPRAVHQVDIEWPESLVCLGSAARVDYVSDKFDGKVVRYFHEFEKPAALYCDSEPQPDGNCMLIIIGKFTIEPDGIAG